MSNPTAELVTFLIACGGLVLGLAAFAQLRWGAKVAPPAADRRKIEAAPQSIEPLSEPQAVGLVQLGIAWVAGGLGLVVLIPLVLVFRSQSLDRNALATASTAATMFVVCWILCYVFQRRSNGGN